MNWGYGWGMGWMMVSWTIFWLVLIGGAVWLISTGAGRKASHEDSPEAILKRRYARGDIDREGYEQRLGDLRK